MAVGAPVDTRTRTAADGRGNPIAGSIDPPIAAGGPTMPRHVLRSTLLALALTLALAAPAGAAGWKLAASDYFNGTALNTAQWKRYNGAGHQGYGLRRPSQVKVQNGSLVLTAQMANGQLTSGGVAHVRNAAYGRYEFRVRTESDPSAATSGTVMTWPQSGNQRRDGENDVYETGHYAGRNPFYSFIHFPGGQYNLTHRTAGTSWHTMVMEWDPAVLRVYRDGHLVRTITDRARIPDARHHLAIQLDATKRSMTRAVHMYVDYVRIYQRG
jgi:beta-glucanase (GH16 family)